MYSKYIRFLKVLSGLGSTCNNLSSSLSGYRMFSQSYSGRLSSYRSRSNIYSNSRSGINSRYKSKSGAY